MQIRYQVFSYSLPPYIQSPQSLLGQNNENTKVDEFYTEITENHKKKIGSYLTSILDQFAQFCPCAQTYDVSGTVVNCLVRKSDHGDAHRGYHANGSASLYTFVNLIAIFGIFGKNIIWDSPKGHISPEKVFDREELTRFAHSQFKYWMNVPLVELLCIISQRPTTPTYKCCICKVKGHLQ